MTKEQTSWDEQEIINYLKLERWVINIANNPDYTYEDLENIIENFICQYYLIQRDEVTTKDIADLLSIAKNLQFHS